MTKDKIEEGFGGCDAVLFCSMMYPPDGSFSVYFMGVDGRKENKDQFENLKDIEWFKVWCLLASRLAASTTLEDNRKEICRQTFERIRRAIWGLSSPRTEEKQWHSDQESTTPSYWARVGAGATAAILIIFEGDKGMGFSVQAPPEIVVGIPDMLRGIADSIEEDINRDIKNFPR